MASKARHFNVPMYLELAVLQVLEQVKQDKEILAHIPVYKIKKDPPDHRLFYAVIGSLSPLYV